MPQITKYMLTKKIRELEADLKRGAEEITKLWDEKRELEKRIKELEQIPQLERQKIYLEILTAEETELREDLEIIRDAILEIPVKERKKYLLLIKSMVLANSGDLFGASANLSKILKLGGFEI